MGNLATAIDLAIEGVKSSSMSTAAKQAMVGQLSQASAYVNGVETAVGSAFDDQGNPNQNFWQKTANDFTAGVVGAALVAPLAPVVVELGALVAVALGVTASPLALGILSVLFVAAGSWYYGEIISNALEHVEQDAGSWLAKLFGAYFVRRDPLILDLDRNGIQLTDLSHSMVQFDLDGDGFRERTAWLSPGDAFLVLDKNSNGVVDNGTELFGTSGINGFEDLRPYDLNNDGIIDANDPIFASLRVWRDINSDGISQSGELVSLNDASAGVVSINLNYNSGGWGDNISGNSILAWGSFKDWSGVDRSSVSVAFNTDQVNTRFVLPAGFQYDPEVFELPNLRGYGEMPDLWTAMSLDPTLKQMVQDLIASNPTSLDDLVGDKVVKYNSYSSGPNQVTFVPVQTYDATAFEDILARWANVAYGADFTDGLQMQGIVEKMMNREVLPESRLTEGNVGWIGNADYYDVYQDFTTQLAVRFLSGLAAAKNISTSNQFIFGILNEFVSNNELSEQESFNDIVDQWINIKENIPALTDILQHYSNLYYDYFTDSIIGDVKTFITEEMDDLPLDANDPWAGYDSWLNSRSSLLKLIDPSGAILDEVHRAYTHNEALPILHTAGFVSLLGDAGNNNLSGGAEDNLIIGQGGDDVLQGGVGSDTYVFGDGFGNDVVIDSAGAKDEIAFQGYLTSDKAQFSYTGTDRSDLLITFAGASDSVTVRGYFDSNGNPSIENITFADGVTKTPFSIRSEVMASLATPENDVLTAYASGSAVFGAAGDDTLKGQSASDVLVGGTGNDNLQGSGGDDIYRFNLGDGQDTIYENNEGSWYSEWKLFDGGNDAIEFGFGIAPGDVDVIEQGANDLLLKVRGTSDQILLQGVVSTTERRIEAIRFVDGTVWSHADLMHRALSPTAGDDVFYAGTLPMTFSGGAGNDTLTGSNGNDTISGDAGDDSLSGGSGNDVLSGGTGTDCLEGGVGDDIYRFKLGDGQDTIYDNNVGPWYGDWKLFDGGNDSLELAEGINPADLDVVEQGADDLLLKIRGTSDQILLQGVVSATERRIEAVRFADGTVWNHADLMQRALVPTSGDDIFYAGTLPMAFSGGAGNDTLTGSDGNDTISGDAGDDIIDAHDGNDILAGGAGNDILRGGGGADDLSGGTGTDRLEGTGGDDVYRFNLGDGQDTIYDNNEGLWYGSWTLFDGGTDRLELGAGITPADIDVVEQGADNLLLTVRGTSDQILLQGVVSATERRLETIHFADGTVWTHTDLMQRALVPTSGDDIFYAGTLPMTLSGGAGNDILTGSDGADILSGDAGNDTIDGRDGNDILQGGAGDDTLQGGGGADDLSGGIGNDRLEGGGGDDIYRFNLGDGQDTIYDNNEGWSYGNWTLFDGGNDRLELGAGISPSDIAVIQQGANDVLLMFRNTGDQLLLQGAVSSTERRLETINFADGTTWSYADLMQLALASTSGDDVLYAGTSAAIMSGGDGNDTLNGSEYNDILYGDAGNDTLRGNGGADTLVGGTGTDLLEGAAGDDVYRFDLGDGQDTIYDNNEGWWYGNWTLFDGGNDRLELGADINPTDIDVIEQGADNLLIKVRGTNDQILLQGAVSATQRRIETVHFADGTVWNHIDLMQRALSPTTGDDVFYAGTQPMTISGGDGDDTLTGSDGNDTINGDAGNDTIDAREGNDILTGGAGDDILKGGGGADDLSGGTGTDRLEGGGGDDVYHFNLGDGQDIIYDNNEGLWYGSWTLFDGGNDRLELGSGISSNDVDVIQRADGNLVLKIRGTSDQIILQDVVSTAQRRIETIRFADGTEWTHADLMSWAVFDPTIRGTANNDSITLLSDYAIVDAGAGNDTLEVSGNGGGRILFGGGSGNDTLNNPGSGYTRTDQLDLQGLNPADIILQRVGDQLKMTIVATGETFTAASHFANGGQNQGLGSIKFADETIWNRNEFDAPAVPFTSSDDNIQGTNDGEMLRGGAGNDTIIALGGNDSIFGDEGNDTIDPGDGNDTVTGGAGNDLIYETNGDDTYAWNRGDGNDRLQNGGWWDGYNVLQLGAGIVRDDLSFNRVGTSTDIRMSVAGDDGSFTFVDGLNIYGDAQVDVIRFADGTSMSHAEYAWAAVATQTTAGDDSIYGSRFGDVIEGGAGDDTLDGQEGNDTIHGGQGNNLIWETNGDDTYVWNRGDGNDRLQNGGWWDGYNVLQLGAGIVREDLSFTRVGTSTDIRMSVAGESGSFTFVDGLNIYGDAQVDVIRFADGSTMSHAEYAGVAVANQTSAGNDSIYGSRFSDVIEGGAGDDTLDGQEGNDTIHGGQGNNLIWETNGDDTYVWNRGDGNDRLQNGGWWDGYNVLQLGAGIVRENLNFTRVGTSTDIRMSVAGESGSFTFVDGLNIYGDAQVDVIRFADGSTMSHAEYAGVAVANQTSAGNDSIYGSRFSDVIEGGAGDDTLDGQEGNDTIHGGQGSNLIWETNGDDTYVWNRGDGNDRLQNGGWWDGYNVLQLGAGIVREDLSFTRVGTSTDIRMSVAGESGSFTFADGLNIYGDAQVDVIRFADGSTMSHAEYASAAAASQGTEGNDDIYGSRFNDFIDGGVGNDILEGQEGNDTIRGGIGDDQIRGGAGSDVAIYEGEKLSFSLASSGGVITVTDTAPTEDGNEGQDSLTGIEMIQFKNGEQVNLAAPIILDLNGDGVSLIVRSQSQAYFDWNGDGVRDHTGWASADDGFLAIDRNGDGVIDGANELSFTGDKADAKSDLDGLTMFDTDGDGKLSASDARFDQFRVWQDVNGDGISSPSELKSLTEAGIASISLQGNNVNAAWGWEENITLNTGLFTSTTGSLGTFADVALNYADAAFELPVNSSNAEAARLVEAINGYENGIGSADMVHQVFAYEDRAMLVVGRKPF